LVVVAVILLGVLGIPENVFHPLWQQLFGDWPSCCLLVKLLLLELEFTLVNTKLNGSTITKIIIKVRKCRITLTAISHFII
jgi:hypothetical protein